MSYRSKVAINYAGQIYVTIIGIVFLPLYIRYMGVEAYGLVGFYSMLQILFNILDFGLTPTTSRETARFHGRAKSSNEYRAMIRSLEVLFLLIASIGGVILYMASPYIAKEWLNVNKIPFSEIQLSLEIIAVIISLRWLCGLYRGIIIGTELFTWLSAYNSIIATLKFVGIVPVFIFIGVSPTIFFGYQLIIAIIELMVITIYAYRILPKINRNEDRDFGWKSLRQILKFSFTIAFTSSLWIIVTQLDKLILSSLLPLIEYGYYTLAVTVASTVLMMVGPIGLVLMPRLAKMQAEKKYSELIDLYRKSTQFVCVVAMPISFTLVVFSEQILWAWTGDKELARSVSPIMQLYVLGNALLAVSAFPYYLQYAKGDLRLHLIGSILFSIILFPALFLGTLNYGAVGAGWAWFSSNMINFLLWIPFIHNRFQSKLHIRWIAQDIGPIVIIAGIITLFYFNIELNIDNRLYLFMILFFFGVIMLIFSAIGSEAIRNIFISWLRKRER